MTLPDSVPDKDKYKFAELMLLVPKDVTFSTVTGEGGNDWIIAMLKEAARFPHHYDTWLVSRPYLAGCGRNGPLS